MHAYHPPYRLRTYAIGLLAFYVLALGLEAVVICPVDARSRAACLDPVFMIRLGTLEAMAYGLTLWFMARYRDQINAMILDIVDQRPRPPSNESYYWLAAMVAVWLWTRMS